MTGPKRGRRSNAHSERKLARISMPMRSSGAYGMRNGWAPPHFVKVEDESRRTLGEEVPYAGGFLAVVARERPIEIETVRQGAAPVSKTPWVARSEGREALLVEDLSCKGAAPLVAMNAAGDR